MFPKSTTLIAAAMVILFAPISRSAVVYDAPSDHTQLIDTRSAFIQDNDVQHVETRQAAEVAELATTVIEGAINIFTSIQDGIKQDKEVSGNMCRLYFVELKAVCYRIAASSHRISSSSYTTNILISTGSSATPSMTTSGMASRALTGLTNIKSLTLRLGEQSGLYNPQS